MKKIYETVGKMFEIAFKITEIFFLLMTVFSVITGLYILLFIPSFGNIVTSILLAFLTYSCWQIAKNTKIVSNEQI